MRWFRLTLLLLVLAFTGCVGGSRGTGVRTLDQPLPEQSDTIRDWSIFPPKSCTVEMNGGEVDLSLSTEFGLAEGLKMKSGGCSFGVSGQALKVVISFKSDSAISAPRRYRLVEHSCLGREVQTEIAHAELSLTTNTISLKALPFKKGRYFELHLFTLQSLNPIRIRIDGFGSGCSPDNH